MMNFKAKLVHTYSYGRHTQMENIFTHCWKFLYRFFFFFFLTFMLKWLYVHTCTRQFKFNGCTVYTISSWNHEIILYPRKQMKFQKKWNCVFLQDSTSQNPPHKIANISFVLWAKCCLHTIDEEIVNMKWMRSYAYEWNSIKTSQ